MKIAKKVGLIFITICIMLNIMQGPVEAAFSWKDVISGGNNFISKGKENGGETKFSDSDIENFVVPLAKVLAAVGTITVVVALIILGIKYMTATPEQAAKIKQQLIGVLVAAVVIFCSTIIWNIMYEVMDSVNKNLN